MTFGDPLKTLAWLSTTYPEHSQLFVPDVNPGPKPLFCRLQGLGVTPDPTPTRSAPGREASTLTCPTP